jgi:hypothetical protein
VCILPLLRPVSRDKNVNDGRSSIGQCVTVTRIHTIRRQMVSGQTGRAAILVSVALISLLLSGRCIYLIDTSLPQNTRDESLRNVLVFSYIPVTLYFQRGNRDISDIPSTRPLFKTT